MNPMWPTIVAVAILVVFGALSMTALIMYKADEAKNILLAVAGLFGVTLGLIGSFFFTQVSLERADDEARRANETAATLRIAHAELESDLVQKEESLLAANRAADDLGNRLAAAKQRESSLYTLFADPEFLKPLAGELTTKGLTPHELKAMIESFSSELADLQKDLGSGDGEGKERG